MILSPLIKRRFDDFNQKLFGLVDVPNHDLIMNGSYPYSPWAGDVDLYTALTAKDIPKVCDIVKQLAKSMDTMILYKVRIGETIIHGDFQAVLSDIKTVKRLIQQAPRGRKWIKPNLLLFTGTDIEEVSILYNMDSAKPLPPNVIISNIKDDIAKYASVPDYYKMLKREKLLLKPGSTRYRYIEKILNDSTSGQLYLARVRAETLEIAKKLPFSKQQIRTALGSLRQLVQVRLDMPDTPVTMKSLNNTATVLRQRLNDTLRYR